jgi:hypothetical protein
MASSALKMRAVLKKYASKGHRGQFVYIKLFHEEAIDCLDNIIMSMQVT